MKNLISYAPVFVAIGCTLNIDTKTLEIDIVDRPPGKRLHTILEKAIADIILFDDTANFQDGISATYLSEFVDNERNPFTKQSRLNVLNATGIMQGDKYVLQVLNAAKVNRSWHLSEKAGECTYFGEICTHRGSINDPHRRGRKSARQPNEYHLQSTKGIGREQLVTPNLQALYDIVPRSVTTSPKVETSTIFSIENLEKIPQERLLEIVEQVQALLEKK